MVNKTTELSLSDFNSLSQLIATSGAIDLSKLVPSQEGLQEYIGTKDKLNEMGVKNEFQSPHEALASYINRKYFRGVNPAKELTLINGIKQAIFLAVVSSIGDGDSVIVFEPYTTDLKTVVELCGARPVYIPLKEPDFRIDWSEVQRAINATTKLMIISSPHLLTGQTLLPEDLEELQRLINGTKIKLVINESLSEMAYSTSTGASVNFYPKLCQITYRIGSLNLPFAHNDSNIAYCIAPEKLMAHYIAIKHAIADDPDFNSSVYLSHLINNDEQTKMLPSLLERNYNLVVARLKDSKFKVSNQTAGYMVLLDYKDYDDIKDVEMAKRLIEKGVGLMPLSFFSHDRQCRRMLGMNISIKSSLLEEALNRLTNL
jgi:methionine aminotransferase